MTRYLRQRDKYSCGPVAIMNIFKWLGYNVNYTKEIEWFREITKCKEDGILYGTTFGYMTKALKMFKNLFTVRYIRKPTVLLMVEHLKSGGILGLCYRLPKQKIGHYILVIDWSKPNFTGVNVNIHQTRTLLSTEEMLRMLQVNGIYPRAWFISKKKAARKRPRIKKKQKY